MDEIKGLSLRTETVIAPWPLSSKDFFSLHIDNQIVTGRVFDNRTEINCARVYRFREFFGLEDGYLIAIGKSRRYPKSSFDTDAESS